MLDTVAWQIVCTRKILSNISSVEIISIEWPAVFTTISVISGDFYVHYFSDILAEEGAGGTTT